MRPQDFTASLATSWIVRSDILSQYSSTSKRDTLLVTIRFISVCTAEELGVRVPSPRRIPDKYMTSSSEQSSSYQAFRGRIGLERRGPWDKAWCASESDSEPYIQIFFRMSFKFGYRTISFNSTEFLICFSAYIFNKLCILEYLRMQLLVRVSLSVDCGKYEETWGLWILNTIFTFQKLTGI